MKMIYELELAQFFVTIAFGNAKACSALWITLNARGVNSRKYDISVHIRYLDKLVVRFHISITWTLSVSVIDIM